MDCGNVSKEQCAPRFLMYGGHEQRISKIISRDARQGAIYRMSSPALREFRRSSFRIEGRGSHRREYKTLKFDVQQEEIAQRQGENRAYFCLEANLRTINELAKWDSLSVIVPCRQGRRPS